MRTILLAALAAPALMLGGCGTLNRGVDTIKQPVVSRTDYIFDAQATNAGLAPGEADRVNGWLSSMRLHYGDHVSVDNPGGFGPGAKAEIAAITARFGIVIDDRAPITSAPLSAGMVRVVVSRSVAKVPGCPDFTRDGTSEFEGSTTSNYGCATQASMAAMIADPLDFVRGQPGTETFNSQASSKAIDVYRKAEPTGKAGLPGGVTSVSASGSK